jgi:NO-binding membrane sensor protein with MHYT domain
VSALRAAFSLLPFASAWGACFAAWFTAFELLNLGRRGRGGGAGLLGAAGLAAAAGVWAQPSLIAAWPATFGFDPAVSIFALAVMIGAAVWGLAVEGMFADARGLIGGGAILGAGIAISHGILICSLRGPAELDFKTTPIATAVAIASALAVGGLALRRWRPGRLGQLAVVVCLTAATTMSQAIERAAITCATGFEASADALALPAAALTPIAGMLIVAVLAAIALCYGSEGVRPATRARAWRGNSPPSPSPSPAGTASPRPASGR